MHPQPRIDHRLARVRTHAGGAGRMIDRVGTLSEIFEQVVIGAHMRLGIELAGDDVGERLRRCDAAQQPATCARLVKIVLGGEIIGADRRRCSGVCGDDVQITAAARAAGVERDQESGERVRTQELARRQRCLRVADRVEVELQVGHRLCRIAAHETAPLVDAHRERAATRRQIAKRGAHLAEERPELVVQGR